MSFDLLFIANTLVCMSTDNAYLCLMQQQQQQQEQQEQQWTIRLASAFLHSFSWVLLLILGHS